MVVRVGTWNVENLFRPGSDAGPSSDHAYDAKLTALADVIVALRPDVLAVQEVGEPEALEDLARRLGSGWSHALADPDGRGIRVGFLSRLGIDKVEQVADFPQELRPIQVDDTDTTMDRMGRPALRVRVETSGHTLDLVSCHWKSKLLTFPGGFSPRDEDERARFGVYALNRRAAEAATVRTYASGLLEGQGDSRAVVVMGDLNDEVQAATTQILLGPPGSEIGTPGYGRPDQGDGWRLWNLAPHLPERERFTRVYRGRPEMIDHILVSRALVEVVGPGDVTTGKVDVPSITDAPQVRRDDRGSDHRPVVAELHLE